MFDTREIIFCSLTVLYLSDVIDYIIAGERGYRLDAQAGHREGGSGGCRPGAQRTSLLLNHW